MAKLSCRVKGTVSVKPQEPRGVGSKQEIVTKAHLQHMADEGLEMGHPYKASFDLHRVTYL